MADKLSLPSGMGGLVRFSEEYRSKLSISPTYFIILIVVIIVLEILLHMYGSNFI